MTESNEFWCVSYSQSGGLRFAHPGQEASGIIASTRIQKLSDKCSKLCLCPVWIQKIDSTNQSKGGSKTADLTVLELKIVCNKYPTVAT